MLFTVSRKLFCTLRVSLYEKWTPKILIIYVIKLMGFNPQTASKTPIRERSPAIPHLLKFAFSAEKRENTLNVSIRFLTDNKSLRKKVGLSAKTGYKKTWLKIVVLLISALFLINSKRTSKASINRFAEMGSSLRAPFSKLKYGVVKLPLITHDCWLFNNTFISVRNFHQNQIFL